MNNTDKIQRVALYIRVSTDEQAKYGYSIESQITRLKAYAKMNNYQVVDIYVDEGKSARTKLSNRKELLRLLDDAKDGKIDRIVIWRLDRWFRCVADYYKIQEVLDKYSVTWECSDEHYETNTAMGRYVLNLKLADAQNESDKTSERIKFNFENMVRNKRPISGALPIGYMVAGEGKEKRVVKDPALQQMAIDMFDKYEDTLSISKTTKYLNETYPFRPIGYASVKKHLINPMYYGTYRDVSDYCEPYISKERYDKICNLVTKNNRTNEQSKHTFIFTSLIKCWGCGRKMAGSLNYNKHVDGTKVYRGTYKCSKHYLDGTCPNNKTISEPILEKWLIDNYIKELSNHVISIEKITSKKQNNNSQTRLKNLYRKIDRINDLYIDGRISKEKYNQEYNQTKELISKEEKLQSNNVCIEKYDNYKKLLQDKDLFTMYNLLSPTKKKQFWQESVDYITCDENRNYHVFFK